MSDEITVTCSSDFATVTVSDVTPCAFAVGECPAQYRAKVLLCLSFCRRHTPTGTPRARQLQRALLAFPAAWTELFFAELLAALESCHHLPLSTPAAALARTHAALVVDDAAVTYTQTQDADHVAAEPERRWERSALTLSELNVSLSASDDLFARTLRMSDLAGRDAALAAAVGFAPGLL